MSHKSRCAAHISRADVMKCARVHRLICLSVAIFTFCCGLHGFYFSRWGPGYKEPLLPPTRIPVAKAPASFAASLFRFGITPRLDLRSTRLLLLVISAPSEHRRRRRIRHTWAHRGRLERIGAAAVFVVGASNDPLVLRGYQQEAAEFGDILYDEKLTDSYKNLTRKVLSALYWVSSQPWEQLRFIGKVDSDCFSTVSAMQTATMLLTPEKAEILGNIWYSSYPVRSTENKWYINKKDYPLDRFPNYVNGPAYMLTLPAVQLIVCLETLQDLQEGRALFLEDVFITGVLRQRLGIQLKNGKKFTVNLEDALNGSKLTRSFVFLHKVKDHQFDLLQDIIDKPS